MTDFNFDDKNHKTAKANKSDIIRLIEQQDLTQTRLDSIVIMCNAEESVVDKVFEFANKDYETLNKLQEKFQEFLPEKCSELKDLAFYLDLESSKLLLNSYKSQEFPEEIFSVNNIPNIQEVYNHKLDHTMGKAELLLCWTFKDCKFTEKKNRGDLNYNNQNYEVKAKNGRMCGQSGFGHGTEVAKTMFEKMKWEIFKKIDLHKYEHKQKILEKAKNTHKWNMGKNDYARAFYYMLKDEFSNIWPDIKELFYDALKSGWKKLFINWSEAELDFSQLEHFYDRSSSKDYELFLLFLNIKYYLFQQNSAGIFFCNNSKYIFFRRDFFDRIDEEKLSLLQKNLSYSLPSFSEKAAQAKVFSVTYKG